MMRKNNNIIMKFIACILLVAVSVSSLLQAQLVNAFMQPLPVGIFRSKPMLKNAQKEGDSSKEEDTSSNKEDAALPISLSKGQRKHLSSLKEELEERGRFRQEAYNRRYERMGIVKDAHDKVIRRAFFKAGVDYEELDSELRRRYAVNRRRDKKDFEKQEKTIVEWIKDKNRKRQQTERSYRAIYAKDLAKLQGNPILKIFRGLEFDRRTLITPTGLSSAGDPWTELPSYRDDLAIRLVTEDAIWPVEHAFFPELSLDNNNSDRAMTLECEQQMTIYRGPLFSGRGNFEVDSLQMYLDGTGVYSKSEYDNPCFSLDDSGLLTDWIKMDLIVHQEVDTGGRVHDISTHLFRDHPMWDGAARCDCQVAEEIYLTSESQFRVPVHFILASPDNGGSDILMTLVLRYHIETHADRHSWVRLDFSPRVGGWIFRGLELHGRYVE